VHRCCLFLPLFRDLEEERNDVTKLGHMNNFFHKLTRNVALGGCAAALEQPLSALQHDIKQSATAEDAARDRQPQVPLSCGDGDSDKQQLLERPASVQQEKQQQQEQQEQCIAYEAHHVSQLDIRAEAIAGSQRQTASTGADVFQKPGSQQLPLGCGKRKNDDAAVAAARERYLARKKLQQGPAA